MTHDTVKSRSRKRRDRPFPWRCANCLKDEIYPETISYTAQMKHDGRLHVVEIPALVIPKCRACGKVVFSNSADDQLVHALRSHLKLLTPQQIKTARKTLGLPSKDLAERLGVAAATVSRWEKGRLIQSRAMDNFLRLYFALPEARRLLRGPDQDPNLGATPVLGDKNGTVVVP